MDELKRILLVEDDPKDVELTLAALAEHKLVNQVTVARAGVEALDYLYRRGSFAQRPAGNPVVILLDLKMPRMDGVGVLQQIWIGSPPQEPQDENICLSTAGN